MKPENVKFWLVLLLLLGLTRIQAQDAVNASGGNASGSNGSASYSVGQVTYTTNTGTNGTVFQGVQLPFEIISSGIEETRGITLACTVYPNITSRSVTLKVENYESKNLYYQLYDLNGKILFNRKTDGNETIIQMENMLSSAYFLKVTDNSKVVRTFKIIKN